MTTALSVLQAITFSGALVLVGVLVGWATKPSEPPAELVATISGWPPPWTPGEIAMLSVPPRWTDRVVSGYIR